MCSICILFEIDFYDRYVPLTHTEICHINPVLRSLTCHPSNNIKKTKLGQNINRVVMARYKLHKIHSNIFAPPNEYKCFYFLNPK